MGKHIVLTTEKEMLRLTVIRKLRYILVMKRLKKFAIDAKMASRSIIGLIKVAGGVDKAFRDFSKAMPTIKIKPIRMGFKVRKRKKSGLV